MSKIIMILIASAALSLSSCSFKEEDKTIIVDKLSNGKTINLDMYDKLIVALAGNPTTGYSWSISEIDSSILKFIRKNYEPFKPILTGSGGKEYFEFSFVKEGSSKLKMIYSRPWEKDITPEDSLTVLVQINN